MKYFQCLSGGDLTFTTPLYSRHFNLKIERYSDKIYQQ